MLVEKVNIKKEFYLAILMDRASNGPVVLASTEGGMDIEAVAAETPDAIITHPVDVTKGLSFEAALGIANDLGLGGAAPDAADQIVNLYKIFLENDATSIEINPLGLLDDGRVCFLDAKFNFDDNAQYRNKELFELRDSSQVRTLSNLYVTYTVVSRRLPARWEETAPSDALPCAAGEPAGRDCRGRRP